MPDPTPDQIQAVLNLPLDPNNDSGATTIRGYLIELLLGVWREGEGFSGKRPFGNSGWEYDLYRPLVAAGMVRGGTDEYGYLTDVDEKAADALIEAAIRSLGVST